MVGCKGSFDTLQPLLLRPFLKQYTVGFCSTPNKFIDIQPVGLILHESRCKILLWRVEMAEMTRVLVIAKVHPSVVFQLFVHFGDGFLNVVDKTVGITHQ